MMEIEDQNNQDESISNDREKSDFAISENKKPNKDVIEIRKEKIFEFFKNSRNWIYYAILAVIVYLSVFIRTRNVGKLKDVATGDWTLGPDLDPFLFLRWAKHIVENGSLMAVDMLRYSPLGYDTARELPLLPYMIAWFHNVFSLLPNFLVGILPGSPAEITVTYSAIMFPVFMFGLTVVAFFLLTRTIFLNSFENKAYPNIIALISCFFLSVIPILLPRTIAGIPEKESAAFFFLFIAFYFFICGWKSKKLNYQVIYALLSGGSTAVMALIWGGYQYIPLVLAISVGTSFIFGQVNKNKTVIFGIWLFSSMLLMIPFTTRYSLSKLAGSLTFSPALIVFFTLVIHGIIFKTKIHQTIYKFKLKKIPKEIFSGVITLILGLIVSSIIFGFDFISNKMNNVISNLVKPATSRLIQTVAENRQPYFGEWSNNFGPIFQGFPVFFWLFVVGSVYLFYQAIKYFSNKEKFWLTSSYIFFLIAVIFSRYSPSSLFNGTNDPSLWFYGLGFLVLGGTIWHYYYKNYRSGDKHKFIKINFNFIFLLSFFFFGIVSARGAVRLIMMLAPPTSIIVSYFAVSLFEKTVKTKNENIKMIIGVITGMIILIVIFSGMQFYSAVNSQAEFYAPSGYTQQWQKAMSWVRDNTSQDVVFGHWWDYGYWLQSIGERTTVLDGGNAISYWNHLMGREVLTSSDDKTALEFLYAHNTTHYLIDSTEIGKYGAYSKIGSDVNSDRDSFIPTFFRDERQIQETANSLIYVYPTGIPLDEDISWEDNGTNHYFMRETWGIGAILIEDVNGSLKQPQAVFVKGPTERITVPLKYLYVNGELKEFENGIEAGVFIFDTLLEENGQVGINTNAAGFYLSPRTVNSLMVRKYLFGEEGNFKLVHSEDNLIVDSLKSQGMPIREFIYFQGNFHGPIKIWEIQYPIGIEFKGEYLERDYPDELRLA